MFQIHRLLAAPVFPDFRWRTCCLESNGRPVTAISTLDIVQGPGALRPAVSMFTNKNAMTVGILMYNY